MDFISSAFMEESEVHPKKGVYVFWMTLLYFYILFFRNCFHNCCHIFIKQWLCISIHYNRDIWMIVFIFCKKNETIPGQLGCSCFSADDSYIILFFCFTGSIKISRFPGNTSYSTTTSGNLCGMWFWFDDFDKIIIFNAFIKNEIKVISSCIMVVIMKTIRIYKMCACCN